MALKKFLYVLLIPWLLAISLTGCGVGLAQSTAAASSPLRPGDWPTVQPTPTPAPATPFPKITLEPTAMPTATPTPNTTPVLLTTAPSSLNDKAGKLMDQASAAAVGLTPVAVALVTADKAAVHQGPGVSYRTVGSVTQGGLAAVFGKNPGGDWLYVLTDSELQGWLPADSLRVTGTLDKAPVLPANPAAQLAAVSAPVTSSPIASSSTNQQSSALSDLKPIAQAQVNTDGLNIRQGPGIAYQLVGALARKDEVTILAVNPAKDWALIESAAGQRGWVSLAYLTVAGSIADAPVLSLPVSQQGLSLNPTASSLAVIEATAPTGIKSSPIMTVAVAAADDPPPATNDLTPIATAQTKTNQVEVRPGPSTGDAPIATITDNQEKIAVLALDQSRSWALVKPAFTELGWVALSDLTVNGSPVPAGTLANAPQVFTAWVESNEIQIRRGPGIYDDVVGTLAINNLVQVLGLDESQSWVLVKPIGGNGSGWAPLQFLKLGASLAEIPIVKNEGKNPSSNPSTLQSPNPPPPTPNPQPHLVFQLASGGDIMVINPDGSGLRRLTQGIDPALSPDGQTVAFTRWAGETGSLWLINIDGTNERQLLGFIKQAKGPEWSPDGAKIVLNFQDGGRLEDKTDCSKVTNPDRLPHPPQNAFDIKVVRKDHRPYFCWTLPPDPHWNLRVVNVADGSFQDLYGGQYAFRPAWDPGQPWRIVADAGNGLLETDINRDYHQNLTDRIEDGSPAFSPDGRYLAVTFGQQGGDQGYDIFRLNRDGSGRVRLTQTPLWVPVVPGNFKQWNNVSPTWSPDGSQIAFLTDRTGRWEIWVMNDDGSNQRPLFSDEINKQLQIIYNFVDERMLSWR